MKAECPECGWSKEVPERARGKKGECPECSHVFEIGAPPLEESEAPSESDERHPVSKERVRSTTNEGSTKTKTSEWLPSKGAALDFHMKIAAWVGGAGLALLALSPLLKWVKFGSGGITGISGDGKIVLGLTLAAAVAYTVSLLTCRRVVSTLLGVQAWGTVAVFWMAGLIWKVGSLINSSEMEDNPLAAALASQVSPGFGLYAGLIGGALLAGAGGYILVRQLLKAKKIKLYYVTQGAACLVGIAIVSFAGLDGPPGGNDADLPSMRQNEKKVAETQDGGSKVGGDIGAESQERNREKEAEKRQYLSHLVLRDIRVSEGTLGRTGVFGEIKNTGSRTLNEVQITVYCLDTNGNPVYEEDFHPVLITDSPFSTGDKTPLKPNYAEEFGYSLEDAPSDWSGNVNVQITNIEFAE